MTKGVSGMSDKMSVVDIDAKIPNNVDLGQDKRLMRALVDNIQKFEQVHGQIRETEMPEIPMNFGGPTAQA